MQTYQLVELVGFCENGAAGWTGEWEEFVGQTWVVGFEEVQSLGFQGVNWGLVTGLFGRVPAEVGHFFAAKLRLNAKVTIDQTWVAPEVIDSFFFLFLSLILNQQKGVIVAMWAFSFCHEGLIEVDGGFYWIEIGLLGV